MPLSIARFNSSMLLRFILATISLTDLMVVTQHLHLFLELSCGSAHQAIEPLEPLLVQLWSPGAIS